MLNIEIFSYFHKWSIHVNGEKVNRNLKLVKREMNAYLGIKALNHGCRNVVLGTIPEPSQFRFSGSNFKSCFGEDK